MSQQTTDMSKGNQQQLAVFYEPRLPYHPAIEKRFGVDKSKWKALCESVFPTASSSDSVVLALSYCQARGLDPMKRVVHIVPIWDKQQNRMVDTVWPGIAELRTTAFRTGQYAGKDETKFGPVITEVVGKTTMTYPEWAQSTVYRMLAGARVAFAGPKVFWLEAYAVRGRNDDSPNTMWESRPFGQIDKCAEAAALRTAFPEEIGSEFIPEEVQGRSVMIDSTAKAVEHAIPQGVSKSDALARQLAGAAGDEGWSRREEQQATEAEPTAESAETPTTSNEPDYKAMADDFLKQVAAAKDFKTLSAIQEAAYRGLPNELGDAVVAACNQRFNELEAAKKPSK